MATTVNDFKRIRTRYPGKLDDGVTQYVGEVWPPDYVENTNSINFDGTTEHMGNTTTSSIFNDDTWTIAVWVKRTGTMTLNYGYLVRLDPSSSDSRVLLQMSSDSQNRIDVSVYEDDDNGERHFIREDSALALDTWKLIVLTHDGSADETNLYDNDSVAGTPDTDDLAFGQRDRAMRHIGQRLVGYVHSVAYWDTVLDSANLTAIYNSGDGNLDLNADSGNYDTSGNLTAWYRLGADDSSDTALGYNYSAVTDDKNESNIMDNASNITTADVVADSPT